MSLTWLTSCVVWALPVAPAPGLPSLAVFELVAETGVSSSAAKVLTDYVVDKVRRRGAFSRVVSSREVEDVLSHEKQRQLMDCDTTSCTAEIAGALGVDLLLSGSLARMGSSYLLNLRIVNVRTAAAVSSVAHRVRADSDDTLLDSIGPALDTLLREGHLERTGSSTTETEADGEPPAPEARPVAAAPPPSKAAETPAQRTEPTPGPGRMPFFAGAAGAVGLGVLAGVAGMGAAAIAVGIQVTARVVPIPLQSYDQKLVVAYGSTGVVAAIALLAGLAAVCGLVAGMSLGAVGAMRGGGES